MLKSTLPLILLTAILSTCTPPDIAPASNSEPRKDPSSPTGYYIPRDLNDALVELDRIMGDKGRAEVLAAKEQDMANYHHGPGTWIRNNWGLWDSNSRLAQYFRKIGARHPDDMSGIILKSYWRKLHNQPIDLEGQLKYYNDYWDKLKAQQQQ